jgi:PAS domain S-box-containing protein
MQVDLGDVRKALEQEELVPCFQPIVCLRTGCLAGFEVLARWQHPEHGLILPENFISLAEQNGLIEVLSRQILRKSLLTRQLVPDPLVLAVNFSPLQLLDPNLPSLIREVAQETEFPLHRLMIEVTETALVNNLKQAQAVAGQLKAMGCRLALDDFGTGYSSLHHLQALPFGELKIDHSFIETMTTQVESRKIVAAVVGLGASLNMITVAEGVETEQQAGMLLWLDCEMAQGWLFGRPLPADKIPEMVSAAPRTFSHALSSLVSERISGLEALPAQRLAQLQAIYNGAPVGLCFLDRNLRYVSLNQRLADLNGAPVAAHIGRKVSEMIPAFFPVVEPYIWRAMKGETISEVEVTKPPAKPGDPPTTLLLNYQPAFDEAHEVIGVSVAIVDISQRKNAELSLHEIQEHYHHLVELNPQIPWILDAQGNLMDISSRWVQLTGLSKERSRNLGWLEAVHPEDVDHALEPVREALLNSKSIDVEYRVKTVDGKWKWMRSRGSPQYGPSGEIVRWYGGTEDIEERKLMEEELRKSRARRPTRSSIRTKPAA